jgi:hypothetical protein
MDPRRFERGFDDSPHPVSRFDSAYLLLPHLIPTRKPVLRPVGSAMVASSARLDRQRFERSWPDTRQIADAQGIQGMGLPDAEPGAIPPGSPACPPAYRQSEYAQGLDQLVPGGIDGGSISEWSFGPRFYLRVAELRGRLIPFRLIARMTGQRQVGDPPGAAPAPRPDVIKLKRHLGLATVGAAVRVLDEQVGTHFPSGKLTVLVLHALDFRVLQQLRVEAHALDLQTANRRPADEPVRPGDDVSDTTQDRGRQPALRELPVVEPGHPVSKIGAAATSARVRLRDFPVGVPMELNKS